MPSGNGSKPAKSPEQVASELRARLKDKLGTEKTEAILQDPANISEVIEGESEAAEVAEIMLKAWKDLPGDTEPAPQKRSRFRRGLKVAIVGAMVIWAILFMKRMRRSDDLNQAF